MAQNVYSRRIFGPVALTAGGTATLYTVPAGLVAVFLELHVINNSATVAFPGGKIGVGGIANGQLLERLPTIATQQQLVLSRYHCLVGGETLQCNSGPAGGSVTWIGNGWLLNAT